MINSCGIVYLIRCELNGKQYIGITNNLRKRWNKHTYDTRHNSKCTIHRAMRKYGIANFSLKQIDSADSYDELFEKEKKYIVTFNTHVSVGGYNETLGGEAPMAGRNHSETTKRLMSERQRGMPSPLRGKRLTEEHKQNLSESHGRSVIQTDKDGCVVNVYRSVTEASKATGVADSNISGVCRGRKKTAGGFHWKYTGK